MRPMADKEQTIIYIMEMMQEMQKMANDVDATCLASLLHTGYLVGEQVLENTIASDSTRRVQGNHST